MDPSRLLLIVVSGVLLACGPGPELEQSLSSVPLPVDAPPTAAQVAGEDLYWCYRGMETPVMEGQPPPCPPQPPATPPGR